MAEFWYLLGGSLLVFIALLGRFLDRLPVSPAMIYLLVGFLLGPSVFNVLELHPLRELALLESIAEIALLIALFTVGIKIRVPIGDWRWSVPLRLATISMVLTILGVALVAVVLFDFDWPLALVLGAVLAPTDPVLASDVQLRSAQDRDNLRFGLTGEGGLNYGTAFPFVLLGLGAMGLHEVGLVAWRWLAVDLIWGTVVGLGIGFLVGWTLARGVRLLRAWKRDTVIFDEFLLLGAIALSYGAALAAGALGFLAVFAAGLALRLAGDIHAHAKKALTSPLTPSMLHVNEQLERIVEVAVLLLVGAMISTGYWSPAGFVLAAMLFLVIRPLSVWIGLRGADAASAPRRLLAWFGIRGIGSVYYAVFFAGYELRDAVATEVLSAVFTVIAASIVLHGIPAAPWLCQTNDDTGGDPIPRRTRCLPLCAVRQEFNNRVMNWDRISGNWTQWKGRVRERWGKLSDDQLDVVGGRREQLSGRIQEVYGVTKDEAERQLNNWQRNLAVDYDEADMVIDDEDRDITNNERG